MQIHSRLGIAAVVAAMLSLALPSVTTAQPNDRITVPGDTVVQVTLDRPVSSVSSAPGQPVSATISPDDLSGFPLGTHFRGTITDVRRATNDSPGTVDMRWDSAVLPNGRTIAMAGELSSLAPEDVQRTGTGRLESRGGGGHGGRPIWIGAAAGAVLGAFTDLGLIRGALLGGLGGLIYQSIHHHRRGSPEVAEVNVPAGTPFGIRLDDSVAFNSRPEFQYASAGGERHSVRVLGARETPYSSATAIVNGNPVSFGVIRPFNLNGTMYFPLAPIARAAGLRFTIDPDRDGRFTLETPDGVIRARAGNSQFTVGDRTLRAEPAPVAMNDVIYVPVEFLSVAAEMHATWDPAALRLDLETGD